MGAAMGGSLSGIAVASTTLMISRQHTSIPPWLPRRMGLAAAVGGLVTGSISYWNSRELVGFMVVAPGIPDEPESTPASSVTPPAPATVVEAPRQAEPIN